MKPRRAGTRSAIKRISVVGLGKLGLPMAAVLASRDFSVVGVDVDQTRVSVLNGAKSRFYEAGLNSMIARNRKRLAGTTDHGEAVTGTDATFVVVPTPSEESGGFSLRYVMEAMEEIGTSISRKESWHLVVLTSTVMPGSMQEKILPVLEQATGKRCGLGFGLCYSPEFIALGNVIRGMLSPDLVLIGESDKRAGDALERIKRRVCLGSPAFARTNFVNAELAKISINTFVTMKMSFANTLAELCESLPGGNVDQVTQAVGSDKRIGKPYMKGATAYGGPCFPRDNVAFARLARDTGTTARLAEATHDINLHQTDRLLSILRRAGLKQGAKVCVLGLSYKPETDVVDESPGVLLCRRLQNEAVTINAYDPAAMENARRLLGGAVSLHTSAEEAIRGADAVIVVTPWREFAELDPSLFRGKTLLDCWGILPRADGFAGKYFRIGLSEEAGPAELN